jgi:CRP-like cAMP-binding protein
MVVEAGGRPVVIRHKNEIFGELASITGKRTATVAAGEHGARLLRIVKSEFLKLCEQSMAVRQYFENVIASRDTSGSFRGFASHFLPQPRQTG